MANDSIDKLSLLCGALSGYDAAAGLPQALDGTGGGGHQPAQKRGREASGSGRHDADHAGASFKRLAYEGYTDGDASGGGNGADGAPAHGQLSRAGGKQTRRVPDERRKLSRQISAYLRFGVLTLPEGSNIKLNNKTKKGGGGGDGASSEYRGAFNTLLSLVFGESLGPWSHVQNWLYLHAGAFALTAPQLCRGLAKQH